MSKCKNCRPDCPCFIFSHRILKKKCRFCGCEKPELKKGGNVEVEEIERIINELFRKREMSYIALKPLSKFLRGRRSGYYSALSHLRIELKKANKKGVK